MTLPRPSAKFAPKSPETRYSSPSSSIVWPVWTSKSMPSKSCFVMKFTTPATASAPYTDEAPPVIVSMRAMAADGIVLMLTAIEALIGIARRPSSSTKFRFEPRPRRLNVAAPGVRWDPAKVLPASNCETAGTNSGI